MPEGSCIPGRMQHQELTVDRFLSFAARWHPDVALVGRRVDGVRESSTYREVFARAKQLSAALLGAGIAPGDRVATLAMNHIGHVEAWYGIAGIGAICHTVNPRLFKEQLLYILNDAGGRLLIADSSFAALVAELLPQCPAIERVILFADGAHGDALPAAQSYEDFLASAPAGIPRGETSMSILPADCATRRVRRDSPRACCTRIVPITCTR